MGLRSEVLGLGLEALGLGFEVLGLGFEVLGLLEVLGLAFLLRPLPLPSTQCPRPLPPALLSDHTRPNVEPFDFRKIPGDKASNPSDLESSTRAQTSNPSTVKRAQTTKPRTLRP